MRRHVGAERARVRPVGRRTVQRGHRLRSRHLLCARHPSLRVPERRRRRLFRQQRVPGQFLRRRHLLRVGVRRCVRDLCRGGQRGNVHALRGGHRSGERVPGHERVHRRFRVRGRQPVGPHLRRRSEPIKRGRGLRLPGQPGGGGDVRRHHYRRIRNLHRAEWRRHSARQVRPHGAAHLGPGHRRPRVPVLARAGGRRRRPHRHRGRLWLRDAVRRTVADPGRRARERRGVRRAAE